MRRQHRELQDFLRESLRIEGIIRDATDEECHATRKFLCLNRIGVIDVQILVGVYAPHAILRDRPGLDVRVGSHVAPSGGPEIRKALAEILSGIKESDPWRAHIAYETLHPFTDGNGRSGRAIWAWQMIRRQYGLPLGFLHQWYYQTLEGIRSVVGPDIEIHDEVEKEAMDPVWLNTVFRGGREDLRRLLSSKPDEQGS